jgi:hypothetical protein
MRAKSPDRETAVLRADAGCLWRLTKREHTHPFANRAFGNTPEFRQLARLWNGKPVYLARTVSGWRGSQFSSCSTGWSRIPGPFHGICPTSVDPWFEEGFRGVFLEH